MRGRISVLVFALGMSALTCLCPTAARADVHLAFGTKWEPLRYTTAVYPGATPPGGVAVPGLGGFQSTSLDPYFAAFFGQKYGAVLGLDVGYGKLTNDTGMMSTDTTYLQFGFSLGFKYYILAPRREKVSPYIYGDFYKYFASVDAPNTTTVAAGQAAGLASPVGATFSFGAEYFVTPSFSVGSEILGLKVAYTEADRPSGTAGMTMGKDSYTYVTFYTGITLNYRFQVQSSASSTEETGAEEQPKIKKKKVKATEEEETTAPAPPPPPPPPSPEAVD